MLDLELVAASMWDDEPVLTSLSPLTFEHKRLAMGGGSFSFTLNDFILRGEGAYYSGKGFSGEGLTILESDYIHYMGGLDYSLSGYNMSIQFIQRAILDYDDSMSNDSYENTMTFMINKSFLRETLTAEIFSYVEFADLNALIRPKVTYDFDDGFAIILGANYFLGDSGLTVSLMIMTWFIHSSNSVSELSLREMADLSFSSVFFKHGQLPVRPLLFQRSCRLTVLPPHSFDLCFGRFRSIQN